ncbi:Tyramine receptor tyra-2 [Frankliniella fusca]|uniref:Tyramine receptor tyra-2 n=1 Tax=Frankliniella fusca TaxID=407009 RepID=A0AAE1H9G0_9NEOP|nr:Tyramine receptor tyra-2 [Frankliniella fusca]
MDMDVMGQFRQYTEDKNMRSQIGIHYSRGRNIHKERKTTIYELKSKQQTMWSGAQQERRKMRTPPRQNRFPLELSVVVVRAQYHRLAPQDKQCMRVIAAVGVPQEKYSSIRHGPLYTTRSGPARCGCGISIAPG